MSAKYILKKTSSGQFMFNLLAANGETVLTSESYTTKASAQDGIEAVRKNSPVEASYERKTATSGEPYFVLRSPNHEVIGTSEMYSSKAAREEGIASPSGALLPTRGDH
jgi:hypothetical protein